MNRLFFVTFFLFTIGCASTGTFKGHGVETEFDRFGNVTTYSANPAMVYTGSSRLAGSSLSFHQITVSAFTFCDGQQKCIPESFSMSFRSTSDGWRFLSHYPITFLIDGEAVRFSEREINANRNTLGGSNVSESLSFPISRELLERIAFSEKVECKIGITEFEMDFARRESLRLLYRELFASQN